MKKIILFALSSLTLLAQDAKPSQGIAEKIKTDLVEYITSEITAQASFILKTEADKLSAQSQQSAGIDFIYRDGLKPETRFLLALDLTKGRADRIDLFFDIIEKHLLDFYYSERLFKEIPVNEANVKRLLKILDSSYYQQARCTPTFYAATSISI
ncbi:hypothetical protein PQO03_00050 [Lentisphaera profundi]|uniref:Uncharacterized protein n=1 Tax=Lentisphaera profundi TaxID=1658616 RepID=A0ABY7VSS2_9BACT|nr:hypothetical protein [Lentisphaera profundi]WDE96359.1 hypothetical protein PQO03_00050 [Lentisphaera profundi]